MPTIDQMRRFIERNGWDMYSTCPCGSDKKYKYCCYCNPPCVVSSKSEMKKEIYRITSIAGNKDLLKGETCLFSNCKNTAIESHAISEAKFLHLIEPNNKATLNTQMLSLVRGSLSAYKPSIPPSHASTFWGFCTEHDNALFSIIEGRDPIIFNDQQLLAMFYRSLAHHYHFLKHKKMSFFETQFKQSPQILCSSIRKNAKPKEVVAKFFAIADLIRLESDLKSLRSLMKKAEKHYDNNSQQWDIKNNGIIASNIFALPVSIKGFVFQTAFSFSRILKISDEEVDRKFKELVNVDDDWITCISLPDEQSNIQNTVLITASSSPHVNNAISDFNTHALSDKKNFINNLILSSIEDLVFTDVFWNSLSTDERKTISNSIEKDVYQETQKIRFENDEYLSSRLDFYR